MLNNHFTVKRLNLIYSVIIMLLYLYNISFKPFPYFIRTRIIFGVLGLFIFFIHQGVIINKNIINILRILLLSLIPILFTIIINNELDLWFIQNIVLTILTLFSSYFVVYIITKKCGDWLSLHNFIKIIVYAIVFHNLIALLMFLIPSLSDFLLTIQNFDITANNAIKKTQQFHSRFLGLGIGSFFLGGVISSLGVILSSYLILHSNSKKQLALSILLFLFITFTGVFIARTTFIGFLLAGIYMFIMSRQRIYRTKYLSFVFVFFILGCIASFYISTSIMSSSSFKHAFELIYSITDNNKISTQSTEHMFEMYKIPSSFKTWLIGDGVFNINGKYYMNTDVGFLRLLYYYGFFGLSLYIGQQFYCSRLIKRKLKINLLMNIFVLFIIIINFKGIGDISYFLYLFVSYCLIRNTLILKKNESATCN